MGLKLKVILIAIMLSTLISFAEAAWQGPIEIINGTWGTNSDQFGIEYGDTNDTFAGPFYVLSDGGIIIRDIINGRRKIYNQSGALTKVLKCVKNQTGDWNEECRIIGEYMQANSDSNIWVDQSKYKQSKYSLYSPAGQLIKTSTTKPPELGIIQSQKIAAKQFKVTVTYPDRAWSTIEGIESFNYKRDINGNFYGLNEDTAVRYSSCGKELGRITMPKLQYQKGIAGAYSNYPADAEVPRIPVALEYGSPVLAPNGDIYTWKRTPNKYSIVKWTWVDDPKSSDECSPERSQK